LVPPSIRTPIAHQVLYCEREGFIIFLGGHRDFGGRLIRVKPITVREAVCHIVTYHWRPLGDFAKSAFQLDDKPEDPPAFQLEPYTQAVVIIQVAMEFNDTHTPILQTLEQVSQIMAD
jgi:hypothetical protein